MQIGKIGSYNLNFNCLNVLNSNATFNGAKYMSNFAPKLNVLNQDSVSFKGSIVSLEQKRKEKEEQEEQKEELCSKYLYYFTIFNDKNDTYAIYEKAMEEDDADFIKFMFEVLETQKEKDFLATQILRKINYDLASNENLYDYESFLNLALNNMSTYSKQNGFSQEIEDENGNSILMNLAIKEPLLLRRLLENIDKLSAAKLMVHRNDSEEYPIGTLSLFEGKNKLTALYHDGTKSKKFTVPATSKRVLRYEAIEILEDDTIPMKLKLKINEIYKPTQKENSPMDKMFKKAFEHMEENLY